MKTVLQIVIVIGALACSSAAQQPSAPPVSIALEDAIKRAQSANTAYAAAHADTDFRLTRKTHIQQLQEEVA